MCRARASKAAVKLGTTLATGTSTGPIALRNSLEKTIAFSPSLTETGPRVRSLHRDFIRSVPWIKRAYGVTFTEQVRALSLFSSRFARSPNKFLSPTQKMRSLLTQAFKDKSTTTDVTTINRLIVMGRMELEETLMLWKGPSHVSTRARESRTRERLCFAATPSFSLTRFRHAHFAGDELV